MTNTLQPGATLKTYRTRPPGSCSESSSSRRYAGATLAPLGLCGPLSASTRGVLRAIVGVVGRDHGQLLGGLVVGLGQLAAVMGQGVGRGRPASQAPSRSSCASAASYPIA